MMPLDSVLNRGVVDIVNLDHAMSNARIVLDLHLDGSQYSTFFPLTSLLIYHLRKVIHTELSKLIRSQYNIVRLGKLLLSILRCSKSTRLASYARRD